MNVSPAGGNADMQAVQIAMLKHALDAAKLQSGTVADPVAQAAAAQPALQAAAHIAGQVDLRA